MKTRRIEQQRLVPHTVDGETELILVTEHIDVPAPPRDWDQLVRRAVTIGAVVLVTVTIVWSTASIGDLLGRVTVPAAAYGAAVAFDLTWILCQAVEWLFRYDPDRARLPRWAGRVGLLVAMGAVFAHGLLAGQWVIGAVGAVVSGLAKVTSTAAMSVHARPLDERTLKWVRQRRASYDAKLAMIPIRREFQRAEALAEGERHALGQATDSSPDADPVESGPDPQSGSGDPLPTLNGPRTVKQAVQTAKDSGVRDPDAVLKYVHQVADANARPDTVARYLRGA